MAKQIQIDILANDRTKQAFNSVKKNTEGTKQSLISFKNVLIAVAGSVVIKQFLDLANTFQNLQNRLKLVTSSTEELAFVQQELFDIAQRTRGGFAETVELYQKLALQSKSLGLQSSQLAQITENVNKVIGIAGVGAVQASSGILQLSQAFASGRLQGDEFRSISENIPPLLDIFAKELGVTRGELKKLGSEGKITSDIIAKALLAETENINEAFSKLSPTIGQASTTVGNSFLNLAGTFAEVTGVSDLLAKSLIAVSKGLDSITEGLKPFTPTIKSTELRIKELEESIKNAGNETIDFSAIVNKGIDFAGILPTDNEIEATKKLTEELKTQKLLLEDLRKLEFLSGAFGQESDEEIKKTNNTVKEFIKTNQNSASAFSQGQSSALKFNQELITQKRILTDISKNILPDTNTELGRFGQIGQDNSKLIDELNRGRFPNFIQALKDAGNTTMQLDTLFTNTFNSFADTLADSIMTGKFAFKDFARSVIADIARIIARQQALLAIQKTLGFFGVTSIGGVDVSSIFGGARANGGSVTAGKSYLVGERGAELFQPSTSGTIIPNNKLEGTGTTNVSFTINTVDARGIDELLTSRRSTIINVINDALNRQGKEALV